MSRMTWIDPHAADPQPELSAPPGGAALGVSLAGTPSRGAVLICPGGGYGHLADHEGAPVAEVLNARGIHAFVLRYRHAPAHRHPAPIQDARRAMRVIRQGASSGRWPVNAARVAVLGFSAGGHLAAHLATEVEEARKVPPADPVERQPIRPDAQVLLYPVIHLLAGEAHAGSRNNLLGEQAAWPLAASLEPVSRVTGQTPPAFLFHTADDAAVSVTNSLDYAAALARKGVSTEVHIFPHGRHGVGLAGDDPVLKIWPGLMTDWLIRMGW